MGFRWTRNGSNGGWQVRGQGESLRFKVGRRAGPQEGRERGLIEIHQGEYHSLVTLSIA